jgi:dTDP-glucose 4,6-dehydratase
MTDAILVTGGAGFIGSAVVRRLVRDGVPVVNVDRLTYAGNLASLGDAAASPLHHLEQVDIQDAAALHRIFRAHRPRAVLHLAAESHVDRSLDGPDAFLATNVVGTFRLLEEARRYHAELPAAERDRFRFVHVSTDEVFGTLGDGSRFDESSAYDPRSPYSATKAGSDHLARAWHHAYGLPVIVTNCSNNYGPCQFPEKLIPLTIRTALRGSPLPVYGDGRNVRDWIHVDDHVDGLIAVLERGRPGRTYLFGGEAECTNIDVVRSICRLLDELRPSADGPYERLIHFVPDRPGHDFRYAIDASYARRELGWAPRHSFAAGLRETVEWYLANEAWCEQVEAGSYRGERLGLRGLR